MSFQSTNHVLMVQPAAFCVNPETLATNAFQKELNIPAVEMNNQAILEHKNMVDLLRGNGIKVTVITDTLTPHTPDSVFPNNWFSTHQHGKIVFYSMCAPNRRAERKIAVLDFLQDTVEDADIVDFTEFEKENKFLEGTGSLVLDRLNNIAYGCISPRTDEELMEKWCKEMGYTAFMFQANDNNGQAIYHTNVLMGIGTNWAVVCLECIVNQEKKLSLLRKLQQTGREIIDISFNQMQQFAGNVLEVCSKTGQKYVVISTTGWKSLNTNQQTILQKCVKIITPNVSTIEQAGGGSVRCVMAEMFS